jgi:acyl-CoA dehydrogenase
VIRAAARHAASMPLTEGSLVAGWLADRGTLTLRAGTITTACSHPDPDNSSWWVADAVPWGRAADVLLALESHSDGYRLRTVEAARSTSLPGQNLAGEPRDRVRYQAHAEDLAVPVPADAAWRALLLSALGRTVQIAGAAESVLDLSVKYVGERVQFGKPLAQRQAVQQMMARLAGETCAATAAADAAVAAVADWGIESRRAEFAVAAAKTRAGRAAGIVARLAHQLHGAIGLTEEYALGAFTMRLWSWRGESGDAEFWSDWLGRCAVDLGPGALWNSLAGGE